MHNVIRKRTIWFHHEAVLPPKPLGTKLSNDVWLRTMPNGAKPARSQPINRGLEILFGSEAFPHRPHG